MQLFLVGPARAGQTAGSAPLNVAITTSMQASGMDKRLFPVFEKETGIAVKLYVVGSGTALRMARIGEVDATVTHAPAEEQAFIQAGLALAHRHFMSNDFLLLGPPADPARAADAGSISAALKRISSKPARFVSRGDDSGTHKFELSLWKAAQIDPIGMSWYEELGQGMNETLKHAAAGQAYVLSDRGSWLNSSASPQLKLLFSGDESMINRYVVMAVKPAKAGTGNSAAARALVEWLGGTSARKLIGEYTLNGKALFDLPPQHAR